MQPGSNAEMAADCRQESLNIFEFLGEGGFESEPQTIISTTHPAVAPRAQTCRKQPCPR
jgi:hypothetical protein